MKKDLRELLNNELEDMAENHIEAWKERYWRKSPDDIKFDLEVNHDDSLEMEFVKERLGRELSDKEIKEVSKEFIEKVLEVFYE